METLKFSILFLFLATFTNAQECLLGNCVDGHGKAKYAKGSYEGAFINGKPEGFGIQTDDLGTYVGYFKAGRPHGKGLRTSKDGSAVEGMFENGKMISQTQAVPAATTRTDGSKCSEGDCQNGYGSLDFAKGDKYQGNFVNGGFHGKENLFLSNGITLSGKFENNKFVSGQMFGKDEEFFFEGTFNNFKPWTGELYTKETRQWINYVNGNPVEKKRSSYYDDEEDENY